MLKKTIFIHFLLFISIIIFSTELKTNLFLEKNDSELLRDLYTINVGIMKFKLSGNINKIDPIDEQNIVDSIKNVLEDVPSVRVSRKEAVLKGAKVYISKTSDEDELDESNFFKRKVFFSDKNLENSLVYELFLKFRNNTEFYEISRKWFENIENPFFVLNISEPLERKVGQEERITDEIEVNENGTADLLIHGEIEKIDNLYFITVYVYSGLLKKRVKEFSFVSNSEDLSKKTLTRFSSIIPSLFSIDYASLSVNTDDEEARIYVDSRYIGKNQVKLNFLVPSEYIITVKKDNYEDKNVNVSLVNFDKKEIDVKLDTLEKLQIVNFYIEPLGTKIFINSLFAGRTPFKKALPKGDYVISAKNDLYESHRYLFSINEVDEDNERIILFHLKSKDLKDYLKIKKITYYASFWNFTFSLATMIPLIVFGNIQYERLGNVSLFSSDPEFISQMNLAYYLLLGFAMFFAVYSGISMGWMFYALVDYLLLLEKKDFIPIIEFFKNKDNEEGITLGMRVKI